MSTYTQTSALEAEWLALQETEQIARERINTSRYTSLAVSAARLARLELADARRAYKDAENALRGTLRTFVAAPDGLEHGPVIVLAKDTCDAREQIEQVLGEDETYSLHELWRRGGVYVEFGAHLATIPD